jgi:hypothetical protein
MGGDKKKKGEFKKGAHDSKGNIKGAKSAADAGKTAVGSMAGKVTDIGKDAPAKKK